MMKLIKVNRYNNEYIAYIGSESQGIQIFKICNSNCLYKVITDLGAHSNITSFTFSSETDMINKGFIIVS